ncbi:hypothetical protein TWF481_002692 [Arthrobotrys musiformis]|uniref:ARS-binding protein 1 N-terminal domain-containing protein n=1 Tax=Arthrobotrys musiformis TaxID=47236 RepID=A0AAV9VT38_9PEZI
MAVSFTSSLGHEDTESPSAQLLGKGSPPLGSESTAGNTSTMDPGTSPSKRKGGRQPVDNSEETKERHAELYRYYKDNTGMTQAKMAEWYTTKFGSTMSQCTVSQVLKKQKLLHGEEIAEPRPRKRKSMKPEEQAGETKTKKTRGIEVGPDGKPIGIQTAIYTPSSQFNNPPSFQAINAPPTSSFTSLATPVSLTHTALTHTKVISPTTGSVPLRATNPSRTNQQPFRAGPNSRPIAPILHHPGTSTPSKTFIVNGKPTSPIGAMINQVSHTPPRDVQTLQSELVSLRRTISKCQCQKIIRGQGTLIDTILTNQHNEKEKIKELQIENSMHREMKGNEHISELLTKIEKLKRDLENERERNRAMAELWSKEEQQLKDLLVTRSKSERRNPTAS